MTDWVQPPHYAYDGLPIELTFTDPPGVVVRVTESRLIDIPMADAMAQPLLDRLQAQFPRERTYHYVFDWSMAKGYQSEARAQLTRWVFEIRAKVASTIIVPPADQGALLRLGISTAALTLRATGIRLEMKDTLQAALEASGMKRAR